MNPTFRTVLVTTALTACTLVATGCAGPDLIIPNPVVSGTVAPNRIVKQHGYAESGAGLPPGSMSDEAVLDTLTPQEACVSVSLHELSTIDLQTASVRFGSDSGASMLPAMTITPPTSQTYRGLVPHTEQTGTRMVCNSDANGQVVCVSQPIITTVMIPGPVEVWNTKGRLCAPNAGVITPTSKELDLEIVTPTAARGYMGFGHGSKKTVFRWAFAK